MCDHTIWICSPVGGSSRSTQHQNSSLRQLPIFDHVFHCQGLSDNRLIFTNQSRRQLVPKILTGISNFRHGHGQLCAALYPDSENPFACGSTPSELSATFGRAWTKCFGLATFSPSLVDDQTSDSGIDSNRFVNGRQGLNRQVIDQTAKLSSVQTVPA